MAEKTNLTQPLRAAGTSGKDTVFFHIWTSHRGIKSVTSVIQRMRESELTRNKLIESRYVLLEYLAQSRGLGKLGHQGAICWLKKELFCRNGTLHIRTTFSPHRKHVISMLYE